MVSRRSSERVWGVYRELFYLKMMKRKRSVSRKRKMGELIMKQSVDKKAFVSLFIKIKCLVYYIN